MIKWLIYYFKFWADKKSAVKKAVASRQAEGESIATSVFTEVDLRIISLIEIGEPEHNDDEAHTKPSVVSKKYLSTIHNILHVSRYM